MRTCSAQKNQSSIKLVVPRRIKVIDGLLPKKIKLLCSNAVHRAELKFYVEL